MKIVKGYLNKLTIKLQTKNYNQNSLVIKVITNISVLWDAETSSARLGSKQKASRSFCLREALIFWGNRLGLNGMRGVCFVPRNDMVGLAWRLCMAARPLPTCFDRLSMTGSFYLLPFTFRLLPFTFTLSP
ncbi:hypothetical protein [Mucilaginibacter ginsenosidivorax]|uniref:Uncharacterized protein n=1 Tax=Mucilaginibacter ginsenosidivorax TaxID=862126 RepID=A0A5B8VXV3_9SPHI|nr:hypothetical protein [Mucilaginibacter ginsenosidivorax]QEC75772.1 hypothetical protein FSB76_07325 [Mucilaginibacter ginsenosidivorax]